MPTLLIAALSIAAILAIYLLWLRPWQLHWGASGEEVNRAMTGDDLVKRPTFKATRAVTIQARPEEIWPWLAQMGCTRGGWYSYDRIDNQGVPSAERILPEFQQIEVGDLIPTSGDGERGFTVRGFEPNRWMLWGDEEYSWCWGLFPLDEGRTRLVTRLHVKYKWLSPWILMMLAYDVGEILMMRKCLLGIKRRAEALSHGG